MASSSAPKASYHARSISLPTRSHPIVEQIDEQLIRLRSSQSASTSSSSSLNNKLNGLIELYSCVDEFLQLPINQQTLSQNQQQAKWVEDTLDGSLRLLDICSTSRDVLVKSKESLQDIQSSLRRRCSGELSIVNEASEYLKTRKLAQKAIKKCLQCIKPSEKNVNDSAIVAMLSDVEAITCETFKSLLSYFAGAKLQSKKSSWSVVARFVKSEKEVVASNSEFDTVDATLSLICQKKNGINMSQIDTLRNQMLTLESEIQEFDEILECLFRHLVKTRASLLNILSN